MTDPATEPLSARALLAPDTSPDVAADARRTAVALALAGLFGAALGARFGAASMLVHAVGVPLGLLAVVVLGVPACGVALAHAGARVPMAELGAALGRAVAATGVVLAGLAPATALVVVSVESVLTASVLGGLALALAGVLGGCRFASELGRVLARAGSPLAARSVPPAFFVFAAALAIRVWTGVLPMLGGAP